MSQATPNCLTTPVANSSGLSRCEGRPSRIANGYSEALALPSEHDYGNGVAIFTRDGNAARDFATKVNAGMVGINVPIPVPVAYYTFGGGHNGDLNPRPIRSNERATSVQIC